VLVNGTYSITLPTAVGISGKMYVVKSISGTTTLNTTSSEKIDSATSLTLPVWTSVSVQSDGTQWYIQ
jgi:hypothetical protein